MKNEELEENNEKGEKKGGKLSKKKTMHLFGL